MIFPVLFSLVFFPSLLRAETVAFDTGWIGTEDPELTCVDGKWGRLPYTNNDCAPQNMGNNNCQFSHEQSKVYMSLDVSLDPADFPSGTATNCAVMVRGYYGSNQNDERLKVTINGTSEIIPDQGGAPSACGGTPAVVTLNKRFTLNNGANLIRFEHPDFCDENAESTGFNSVNFQRAEDPSCTGAGTWRSPTRDVIRIQCYIDSVCGNGATEAGEQCDDGNTVDGDGCSATCQIESTPPPPPPPGGGSGCGDGVVQSSTGEHCDDGNTHSNDECNEVCLKTYDPPPTPADCPFTAGPNDVLINIAGQLRMYSPLDWGSIAGSFNVTIPPGNYNLYMATSDSYFGRDVDTPQSHERMILQVFNDTNINPSNLIFTSSPTPDLPDSVRTSEWWGLVDANINIPQTGRTVLFKHYGFEQGVPLPANGLFAVCALFQDIDSLCGNGFLDPGEYCDDGNNIDNDECSNSCTHAVSTRPSCPFTADPNDILVNFPTEARLFSDPDFKSVLALENVTVPAGTYRVSIAVHDEYPSRAVNVPQPDESVFLKFYSSTEPIFEDLITVSSATPDLADSVPAASFAGVVDSSLVLSQTAASVGAKHAAYPDDSSPNGLDVLCALLEPVSATYCGDGTVQFPNSDGLYETCDDGNTVGGDGCSATCQVETAVCRNGIVEAWNGEQCDDGNDIDNDGCNNACQLTVCGDGVIQTPNGNSQWEQCDDGNTVGGDGCSATCQVETPSGVGVCGAAVTRTSCAAPETDLCTVGVAGAVSYDATNRRWRWSCGSQACDTGKSCAYVEINP